MEQDELYHYGIKGMKWGVRRFQNKGVSRSKHRTRHIGLTDKGNIGLIEGKTTKKAKQNFAIKASLSVSTIALSVYIAKHPETIIKGKKAVDRVLRNNKTTVKQSVDSGIYSKSLGRMLTVDEAIKKGLY